MVNEAPHTELKNRLIQIIREKSYQEGDFVLASGKKSKFYIDVKRTALDPEGAFLIGNLGWAWLEMSGLAIEGVGGLTLGADPLATSISLMAFVAEGIRVPAFIVRKEPKGHGTQKYIEGIENIETGSNVLIVEDVATTGESALLAVERSKKEGLKPVAVLTVIDREDGARAKVEAEGLKFHALVSLTELKSS